MRLSIPRDGVKVRVVADTSPVSTNESNAAATSKAWTQMIRQTALFLPGQLVPVATNIIAVPIFTYYFPSSEYGAYALALNFATFLNMFCGSWLESLIIRFYHTYSDNERDAIFFPVINLLYLTSIAIGFFIVALSYIFGPESVFGGFRGMLLVSGLVFWGQTFLQGGLALLRVRERAGSFSVITALAAVLKLVVGLVLAVGLSRGVIGILWAAAIVPGLLYILFLRKQFTLVFPSFGKEQRRFLLDCSAYGLPLAFSVFLNFLHGNADRYILQSIRGGHEVGVYSIAVNIIEQPIGLLFSSLLLAAMPAITKAYEKSTPEQTKQLLSLIIRMALMLSLPVSMIAIAASHTIFKTLAKGDFTEGWTAGAWLVVASLFLGLRQFSVVGLHLSRRTGMLAFFTIIAVVVNIAFNFLVVPFAGYQGCAMVKICSQGVLLILGFGFSIRCVPFDIPFFSIFRILAASAIASGCVYELTQYCPANILCLGLLLGAGLLVYAVLIIAFRELRITDIQKSWPLRKT
jgi:O-antigen/teichoic acid export membrane protein